MNIVNIKKESDLNSFIASQANSQFLQSWQWGEFQNKVAGETFRWAVIDNNEILATAILVKKTLPMGKSYFFCPRGPVFQANSNKAAVVKFLFEEIIKIAKAEGVIFMRFEPAEKDSISACPLPIEDTIDIEPKKSLILDLAKTEDELLKEMHPKTRYNIRLAEKKGVKIIEGSLDDFEDLWRLLCETNERDNFRLHGKNYYQKMLELDNNFLKLFFAEHKGKKIAVSIITFFGDTATYVHGASSGEQRNLMAPHLLQWHNIKVARKAGFKRYDFFGIDEKKWPGVTRFKKGFGGAEVDYPGTFDLIIDAGWYSAYKTIRKIRRTF